MLIDSAPLTQDEEDYLDLLGSLMIQYEQSVEPISDISAVNLLKVLLTENQLRQKDLVFIFKTESIVSEVLNNRRKLSVEHIQLLAND